MYGVWWQVRKEGGGVVDELVGIKGSDGKEECLWVNECLYV
jgi:hypothetical protein